MFGIFKRKKLDEVEQPTKTTHLIAESGQELLKDKELKEILARIRSLAGVSDELWSEFYLQTFINYAELVQKLPVSKTRPIPLLKYRLQAVNEALRLRSGLMLPKGADAETLDRLKAVWTYACATSVLLHNLGRVVINQQVTLTLSDGKKEPWQPIISNIPVGTQYLAKFSKNIAQEYNKITPLLASRIVPSRGLDWLASDAELIGYWMTAIQNDLLNSKELGEILTKANESIAAANKPAVSLETNTPEQTEIVQLEMAQLDDTQANRPKSFAEVALEAIRHLLDKQEFEINCPGAAIFVTENNLWLVEGNFLDSLRAQIRQMSQGSGLSDNKQLIKELEQQQVIEPSNEKASWQCQLVEGDWSIELSLLKLDLNKVWPNKEEAIQAWVGQVIPLVSATEASTATEQVATNTNIEAENTSLASETDQPNDDLILPYDTPLETESISPSSEVNENETISSGEVGESSESNLLDDDLILPYDSPLEASDTEEIIKKESEEEAVANKPAFTHTNAFLAWLQEAILTNSAEVNAERSRVYTVKEGLFLVSPSIFRDFDSKDYNKVQQRFLKMRMHQKKSNGTNFWSATLDNGQGGKFTIKGILIEQAEAKLGVALPPANPHLTIIT